MKSKKGATGIQTDRPKLIEPCHKEGRALFFGMVTGNYWWSL